MAAVVFACPCVRERAQWGGSCVVSRRDLAAAATTRARRGGACGSPASAGARGGGGGTASGHGHAAAAAPGRASSRARTRGAGGGAWSTRQPAGPSSMSSRRRLNKPNWHRLDGGVAVGLIS